MFGFFCLVMVSSLRNSVIATRGVAADDYSSLHDTEQDGEEGEGADDG